MNFKITIPNAPKQQKSDTFFSVLPKKLPVQKEAKLPIQHFFITNSENSLSIRFNENVFGVRKSPYQIFQQNTDTKYNENITKVLKFIKKLIKQNTSYDEIETILKQGEFATGFKSFLDRIDPKEVKETA